MLVFLTFLQPARSAPSLRPPCLRFPLPGDSMVPSFMSLRPREAPAPQGGSQDVTFFVISVPIRTGAPWGQGLVLLLHRLPHVLGTQRPGQGDQRLATPAERVSLTQVLGYPTLFPVLMEDALQANCMTIMWIQTGLSISNFQIIQFDLNPGKGKQKVLNNFASLSLTISLEQWWFSSLVIVLLYTLSFMWLRV